MTLLVDIFYTLSNVLLWPVTLLLLALVIWTLLEMGGFAREYLDRRRAGRAVRNSGEPALCGFVAMYVERAAPAIDEAEREYLIDRIEVQSSARLARLQMGLRLGPTFGLMGTLIPMGPALESLAQNNVRGIADNLIVAFGTTVLGLFVAGTCYSLATIRRHWYAADLCAVRLLATRDSMAITGERPVSERETRASNGTGTPAVARFH